jgi:hypothetical protein
MTEVNIDRFTLPYTAIPPSRPRTTHRRLRDPFLRGPVPMLWLNAAARLPGKALHVGIRLWFLCGLTSSRRVQLSLSQMQELGFDRKTAARGLLALQLAGLVEVERHQGRNPRVTIMRGRSSE